MRTGREFIIATMNQTLSVENIFSVREILNIMYESVKTNITLGIATNYIPYMVSFEEDRIRSEQLPGASEYLNGTWIFIHDEEKTKAMVYDLFFCTKSDLEPVRTIQKITTLILENSKLD